jgi:hypothetical protein
MKKGGNLGIQAGLHRSVRLRAGGDLEERTTTAAKFTQHFTSFKCQRI